MSRLFLRCPRCCCALAVTDQSWCRNRFNQVAQGVFITLPYTLAVYMVRKFEGEGATEAGIGRLTGLLVRKALRLHCTSASAILTLSSVQLSALRRQGTHSAHAIWILSH